MSERRIFYRCPDWDGPTGGILVIYRHVEILARHGIPAYVLHQGRGFRASWFASDAPVASLAGGPPPRGGDVLVFPEGCRDEMREAAGKAFERAVFAQNWAYVYGRLEPGEDWRDWGIRRLLCVSRYIQRLLLQTMELPSALVHPGIDVELFRAGGKRLQIACMPRKNPKDLRQIEGIFRARFPRFRAVPFVPIDAVPHARVAELLAESAVFLATGYPEGCPLPPLEAMACECLVVGFTGRGGGEYMRHGRNCLIAGDGDVVRAADLLGRVVGMVETEEGAALRRQARRTAERFSLAAEEKAVHRYWRRALA